MFLYPEFTSVNSLADVRTGQYHGICSVYVDRKSGAKALLHQYWLCTELKASIAELQMIDPDGQTIRFLDFMELPDGSWRDSHGLRAEFLEKLIPEFLASFSFFEQVQLGTQIVEAQNVQW